MNEDIEFEKEREEKFMIERKDEGKYLKVIAPPLDYKHPTPGMIEALNRITYRYIIRCKCGRLYQSDKNSRPCPLCCYQLGKRDLSLRSIQIFKESQSLLRDELNLKRKKLKIFK